MVYNIKKTLATITILLSWIFFAQAQMDASIPVFIDIELESGAITVPSFDSKSDLEGGLESSLVLFKIKANHAWKVETQIGTIISTPVSGGPTTINNPLTYAHFKYIVSPDQSTTFNTPVQFTSPLATVLTGFKNQEDKKFSIKFKITPGLSVDPASYTIPIIYSISPN